MLLLLLPVRKSSLALASAGTTLLSLVLFPPPLELLLVSLPGGLTPPPPPARRQLQQDGEIRSLSVKDEVNALASNHRSIRQDDRNRGKDCYLNNLTSSLSLLFPRSRRELEWKERTYRYRL